jgi:hypothetical protein
MRNYSTQNHNVFPRIDEISIKYPASGVPVIEYVERQAVVLNGVVTFLNDTPVRHTLGINPPAFADKLPVYNLATGEKIEGKEVTMQELLLGMGAVIRNDQLKRDGAFNQPEQTPELT